LAQVLYDQKKYDAGIAALAKAQSGASADFSAAMEGTIAVGYEAQGKFGEAADHYGKAAGLAKFSVDKGQYQSAQARAFMAGGKAAEAGKLWTELSKEDNLSFSQEAQVRLGEIAGLKK
jgi:tetratricopeptide (TPR) repeat protein